MGYLKVDPDGNRLFISHSNTINVLDLATGKQVGEIPASGAHGIALCPRRISDSAVTAAPAQ